MTMKGILIIDEKKSHSQGTAQEIYHSLPGELKELVRIETNMLEIAEKENDISVRLKINPENYAYIFLHDSFDNRHFDEGQVESFKSGIDNLVVFSGGKSPDIGTRVTSRAVLFANLERCLKAYLRSGYFPIKLLFDGKYQSYYPLLDHLEDILIRGEGTETFIRSRELSIILEVLGYTSKEIETKILPIYAAMGVEELNEKIESFREKKI